MSKSIRIRDHLYEEIARLAEKENRPLVRQLEILLEQALRLKPSGGDADGVVATARSSAPRRTVTPEDPHFKPDFK